MFLSIHLIDTEVQVTYQIAQFKACFEIKRRKKDFLAKFDEAAKLSPSKASRDAYGWG